MKRFFLYIFLGLFLVVGYEAEAQVISEAAARAEIRKRGLNEDEVLAELAKKGIDLNTLDVNNPTELSKAETALREVLAELEKKKTDPASDTTTIPLSEVTQQEAKDLTKDSEEISEAIEEGATLEEAVAETLQETQEAKLPPPSTYGQHIFRNKSLKVFRQIDDAQPPSSYVLGPGDKLAINIWGISEESVALEINSEGYVKQSGLPRVYLSGLTIAQAKDRLKSFYSRTYRFRDEDFDVSLATARTITVNIVGEVENSGSYTISALNTVFNALVAAGGPSDIGSVRNIQLISGTEVKDVDIYEFLLNPVSAQNFYLKDGDFINVPVARKLVNIAGAIKRPFTYELKDDEGLEELLNFAGGLTDRAIRKTMKLVRVENDEETLLDIPYAQLLQEGRSFQLRSGDAIEINTLPKNYENIVRLSGAFLVPGEYAFEEGMRVSDLIGKTELMKGAILDSAYLKRINEDNITVQYQVINLNEIITNPQSNQNVSLNVRDEIIVRTKMEFTESQNVNISGSVRTPGDYQVDRAGSLKISDLIFLSGGLKEDAADFGFLYRKNLSNPFGREYIRVNINDILDDPEGPGNLLLIGGDQLFVYSKTKYLDELSVYIGGAVREPSEFTFDPSLTLNDLIELAGGLKLEASPKRIEVFRLDISADRETEVLAANLQLDENFQLSNPDFRLQPFDRIYVRQAPEFELQRIVTINGEVKYPGAYPLLDDNETISSLISRAGGFTQEAFLDGASLQRSKDDIGYVIINLDKAINQQKSEANVILQEGDVIEIPKQQNLVAITGATNVAEFYPERIAAQNKINVSFIPGKNAKYYIDEYTGGIAKTGDAGKVTVTYANGEVKKSGRFLFWRTYPKVKEGSVINVGVKDIEPPKAEGDDGDVKWGEVLADSVAQATAILSLVLLLQRID